MSHFKRYVASAAEPGGWQAYMEEFVQPGEATYQDKNGGIERMAGLPLPVF
jgi:glutaconate CoA-transferase subunit A